MTKFKQYLNVPMIVVVIFLLIVYIRNLNYQKTIVEQANVQENKAKEIKSLKQQLASQTMLNQASSNYQEETNNHQGVNGFF